MLKNWCFWTVVLEKTLESPWTTRRSNHSILKGISPEYSLEGLMLKLKLQWCKELTHWKWPWCWEILKGGWEGDDRGWDGWMASLTWWTWVEYAPGVADGQGGMEAWCAAVHGVTKSQTWLSDWTELNPKRNMSIDIYNCRISKTEILNEDHEIKERTRVRYKERKKVPA